MSSFLVFCWMETSQMEVSLELTIKKVIPNLWYVLQNKALVTYLCLSFFIELLICRISSVWSHWGFTYEIHTKSMYLLQKKVVRAIAFKSFTSPSTPIFSEFKTLQLDDLLDLKLFTFVYESVNLCVCEKDISFLLFKFYFKLCQKFFNMIPGRRVKVIFLLHNTLQYGARSVRYAGAKSWNNIPLQH